MTSETQTQARNEPVTEAGREIREWVKDVVRAVPAVPIRDTEAVPTFKRRVTACIDRAAVLLAIEHAPLHWKQTVETRDAALREQTRITPIDVERLAQALDAVNLVIVRGTAEEWAEKVAAEYARLSKPRPRHDEH